MHRSSIPSPGLCEHLIPGPVPFVTLLVLDDHLGPTELLVRCRHCATSEPATWLLEMLDWLDDLRLFRIRTADPVAAAGLLRDLDRGSCDLRRAQEQVRHFGLSSERLSALLLLNQRTSQVSRIIEVPEGDLVPGAGWRDLPCDGSWIRQLCD